MGDPEGPGELLGNGCGGIGYGIGAAGIGACDYVAIGREFTSQVIVAAKDFRGGREACGVGHGGIDLCRGFVGVALGAFGGADEVLAGCGRLGGPPTGGLETVVGDLRDFGAGGGLGGDGHGEEEKDQRREGGEGSAVSGGKH